MIPIKLALQNFMSYGYAELSFEGIHTACLTGNNGNGKSALLDAITWAVWGQARGVDKNGSGMDDLVRLGCDEMAVEFCFELDDQLYRIIRKRDKRRQVSALELQLKAGNSYRSLSGDKLGMTQQKIGQILKLDYETFTNSAFILQGRADSFTTQKAGDRKRILAEVLGLSYYDQLERKARDKMNQAEFELKELERKLKELEHGLAREAGIREEWETVKGQNVALDSRVEALEQQIEQLSGQLGELRSLEGKRQEMSLRVAQNGSRAEELNRQASILAKKITGLKEILEREDQIAAGYQQLQQAVTAEEEASRKQTRAMDLLQARSSLESKIAAKKAEVSAQIAALYSEKTQLSRLADKGIEAEQKLPSLEQELDKLTGREQQALRLQETLMGKRSQTAAQESSLEVFRRDLLELRQRYKTLHGTISQCPLCSTELDSAKREKLLKQLAAEGEEKKARLRELEQEIFSLRQAVQDTEDKLQELRPDGKAQVQTALELVRRDMAEGRQAADRLARISDQEQKLRTSLEDNSFGGSLIAEINLVVAELEQLAYDQEEHRSLRTVLNELRPFATQYAQLSEARAGLPAEEELLSQFLSERARILAENASNREMIDLLQQQVVKLPGLEREYSQLKAEIAGLRERKTANDLRLGALEEEILQLARLKELQASALKQREETAQRKQQYSQLVIAFGKKGIQAMIIENAVPELQDEANRLLARMTDGRMHLALITQRDTKKGSVAETLELRIADELGTRKYEMFSGGEAFRVNFALRIALSKLLARRAGARLQTLVIDEGFGTQDGNGREKLVDVINAIKDEFVRIIIITHIQELKEAFPLQIEVEKTAEGSSLRLI